MTAVPFIEVQSRYGVRHEFKHDSLADAVKAVAAHLEGDESWPVAILGPDREELWQQSGPLTTTASLRAFALEHGITLP